MLPWRWFTWCEALRGGEMVSKENIDERELNKPEVGLEKKGCGADAETGEAGRPAQKPWRLWRRAERDGRKSVGKGSTEGGSGGVKHPGCWHWLQCLSSLLLGLPSACCSAASLL